MKFTLENIEALNQNRSQALAESREKKAALKEASNFDLSKRTERRDLIKVNGEEFEQGIKELVEPN